MTVLGVCDGHCSSGGVETESVVLTGARPHLQRLRAALRPPLPVGEQLCGRGQLQVLPALPPLHQPLPRVQPLCHWPQVRPRRLDGAAPASPPRALCLREQGPNSVELLILLGAVVAALYLCAVGGLAFSHLRFVVLNRTTLEAIILSEHPDQVPPLPDLSLPLSLPVMLTWAAAARVDQVLHVHPREPLADLRF